ncbi:hypothetical protein [Bradyrhizobium sp. LA7.1]|uniref:hypothetical protein n=1 Tax=Bradyrhizobium sp. LA7.1 TaxID=3156324 RepID=UPI00339A2671
MTPEQKAAYDAIIGMAHRVAMKIAELPREQRATAVGRARELLLQTASEHGDVSDPKLLVLCADGIAVVLREIEMSGSSEGGHA